MQAKRKLMMTNIETGKQQFAVLTSTKLRLTREMNEIAQDFVNKKAQLKVKTDNLETVRQAITKLNDDYIAKGKLIGLMDVNVNCNDHNVQGDEAKRVKEHCKELQKRIYELSKQHTGLRGETDSLQR